MKKNNFILILFVLLGLLTGSIIGELLLTSVEALSFLTKSAQITWQPKADLNVLKYDFNIQVKLNLASIIGVAAAFWLYRKI